MPLVVKIQPTPKTDTETTKEQRQEEADASAKWWTVFLGIITGIVGVLQLVAIGFQARIAKRQNEIIQTQNTIMEGQRKAADAQSGYMREGLVETRNAAAATAASAATAERTLRLANQPYFDVTDVEFGHAAKQHANATIMLNLSYQLTNVSGVPAALTGLAASYKIRNSGDGEDRVSRGGNIRTTVSPGRGYRHTLMNETALSDADRAAYLSPTGILIDVEYRLSFTDPLGGEHDQTITRIVRCNRSRYSSLLTDEIVADETDDGKDD